MELVVFDILKESVSVHQPLPRIIASNDDIQYLCAIIMTLLGCTINYIHVYSVLKFSQSTVSIKKVADVLILFPPLQSYLLVLISME